MQLLQEHCLKYKEYITTNEQVSVCSFPLIYAYKILIWFSLKTTNDHIKPTDRVGLFENGVKFSFKEHLKYTRKHNMLCAVPESRLQIYSGGRSRVFESPHDN